MIIRKQVNEKMSRIVEHNGVVYFAGIVSDDKELDIKVQAKRALEIAEERFKEAGVSKHTILRTEIFLKDIYRDFEDFNKVWKEWIPENDKPARSCVQANMASHNTLIELVITAAKE
ncbi:RidA family protein [Halarcobacter sp.]|uniref:RidA family protein n=1 Tax=Halarcobacter sp. TaxID=2321133 RepID=UPI0029F4A0AB|nr:RidA family protein [Halarcobacter sp.]